MAFRRKVQRSFTLSNGQRIPSGVIIELPVLELYRNDDVFPNARRFDPLRFYKVRELGEKETPDAKTADTAADSHFASVGKTNFTFGQGRHACPGRIFAVSEMKMIIGTMLMNYDIKMVDGVVERYKNLKFGVQV